MHTSVCTNGDIGATTGAAGPSGSRSWPFAMNYHRPRKATARTRICSISPIAFLSIWAFIDPLSIYPHSPSFIWDVTDMMYDTPCSDPVQIDAQAGRRTSVCRLQPPCIDTTYQHAHSRLSPHLNIKHSYFSSHVFCTEMIDCTICIHATPVCIHAVIRPRRRPVTVALADSRVFTC